MTEFLFCFRDRKCDGVNNDESYILGSFLPHFDGIHVYLPNFATIYGKRDIVLIPRITKTIEHEYLHKIMSPQKLSHEEEHFAIKDIQGDNTWRKLMEILTSIPSHIPGYG